MLRHIVSDQTAEVTLPQKNGWTLKLLPAKINGLSLQSVKHDTLVWVSDDKQRIGLSDPQGERFRAFDVKSISNDPSKDVFFWRSDVVWLYGFDGKCYVGYILNWAPFMAGYEKTPENTVNPTQMWALSIDENDRRGILRVVDGYQYWGMCMHPYRLEDGSMLHWWTATHRAMNAEAGYRIRGTGYSTLALEDLGTDFTGGGMPERVKCLHVLIAYALAEGPERLRFGTEAVALAADRGGLRGTAIPADWPTCEELGFDAHQFDDLYQEAAK